MQLFGNLGMGVAGKTKQAEKGGELHSRALNFANMSSIDINESGRPLAPTEISYIARHVTYPQLRDHPSVEGRDAVLGLAANVVFVNHTYLENQADHGLQH